MFGHLQDPGTFTGTPVPVATAEEVHTGQATILANVAGTEVEEYTVEILKVYSNTSDTRDLMLRVTDPRLLEKTGGIVQGMSGSPILQDGKLVGARHPRAHRPCGPGLWHSGPEHAGPGRPGPKHLTQPRQRNLPPPGLHPDLSTGFMVY